jgi:hypothetical protein
MLMFALPKISGKKITEKIGCGDNGVSVREKSRNGRRDRM